MTSLTFKKTNNNNKTILDSGYNNMNSQKSYIAPYQHCFGSLEVWQEKKFAT